ncbi:PLP-dependent aminotransferase family protein [Paenibacillus melissococcoides]|uniref:PLP-dependent aminotransferase family protein n=1 Tax=Paenibacillus melissococcoides TaxID=2912268 RepID=A0ABM9G4K0_9BACL|nr:MULTISPECIES: PLP-dependent aminotransferase family protein [Paenibacillus]MEB9894539.1 PLP-dependent aminotransferase family protein [Bacillus cereus]CAH8246652.1 PLP-dependent aminotransferase family protein [Paenibacillus melissococcoides]CAH8715356.1 PLP-dependent aminotransferase family protein [Paenibacillus melissococcoides]CAH8716308.1 PLP-dependent aminotransferase family protein [Paenibacillus melissococcoides]GIO80028.1 GntR family transcriptional regulator [Paenibacillus dendrit
MWMPDRGSSQPLYQQIADDIERRIAYGEFPPGSLLPSERKLAAQLGVNRSTVILVYAELRALGIIESRSGSGTRVSKYKWGATPKHTPNWHRYCEGGSFLPNVAFLRRIREALQQDSALIDFASGELGADLSPVEEINALIDENHYTGYLGYDNPQGFLPLREALVSFLSQYRGIQTTESSILITSGSQQSLYLITQCLLAPGDAVAIEDPSYCYSLPMFQSAGLRLFRLPVDQHGIRPEDVRTLYKKHRIKMVFLNPNYQNPTGAVLDAELLHVTSELGLPIVEDDPFSLTAYEGSPPRPLKSMDSLGSVLYIGSFSKIAASGLRVGWMVAPHSVVDRLADARQQMDFGLSVVPQKVAAQFLKSAYTRPHLDRLRMNLHYKRDAAIEALQRELPGLVSFPVPQGGLHLWCKILPEVNDGKLLEEAICNGVIFAPGSVYGSDSGYVRFTYARPKAEEIAPGIAAFAASLRAVLD